MLIITTLSLLMAAAMGWMALRLLRDEQRRSEARVAALTAALDMPREAATQPEFVGFDTPRAVASRPAIIARDDSTPPPFVARAATTEATDRTAPPPVDVETFQDDAFLERPMFGGAESDAPPRDDRRWLAVAAAVLVVLGITSVVWSTSRSSEATATAPAAVASAGGVPMDLVSLGHERTEAGLIIRGLVRNPVAGSTRTSTFASVFLFDEAGGFLGSGRSVLDTPTLTPGDEAGFEVTLPANAKVRRYRVTFRAADGTVVPHLDKRPRQGR